MVIGTKKQVKDTLAKDPCITLDGTMVERVLEARNLGLNFDSSLRFEKHVMEMVKNCFYRLKILYRIRQYIDVRLRIQLCESLILSKLNYADTVYGPCLLRKTEKILQRVQNACARYCFTIPPRSHVTPFLNKGGLLKIAARWKLHLATLLFGVVKQQSPDYLYDKLDWARNHHSISTRASAYLMLTPKHKTAMYRHCFQYLASHIFNNIPPPIRDLKTISSFKIRYKQYLLHLQKTSN